MRGLDVCCGSDGRVVGGLYHSGVHRFGFLSRSSGEEKAVIEQSPIAPKSRKVQSFLTPPPILRWSLASVYGLLAALGILTIVVAPSLWILGTCFIALGGYLCVRGFRAGVLLESDSLTVRGLISSRTIRRNSLVSVDRFPFISWRSDSGATHDTPVTVFMSYQQVENSWTDRYQREVLDQLETWQQQST